MPEPRRLAVVTTCAPYKSFDPSADQSCAWLDCATTEMGESLEAAGWEASFFAAIELDGRGLGCHRRLIDALAEIEGWYWTFSLDDDSPAVTTDNRLARICAGRNIARDWACRHLDANAALFLDSDLSISGLAPAQLLELADLAGQTRAITGHGIGPTWPAPALLLPDGSVRRKPGRPWPVVGGDVPSYCLSGPYVPDLPWPVQAHWNTAGFLLVQRYVLDVVAWGYKVDPDGLSDDPWFQDRVRAEFGTETLVRKDVVGDHAPLVPLEQRGQDLALSPRAW